MKATSSRLEMLFQKALEISSAGERENFLLRECGEDIVLRRRVESLIAAHLTAGNFLDPTAPRQTDLTAEPDSNDHSNLGIAGVRVRQKVAEGGFSVVYLAEQFKPMYRPVALKILKPGLDLQMGHRRFKAEREALAALDHPNIVRIHEAGTTSDRLPYLLLEWIRGPMVTHYADAARLGLEKRLSLFLKLCAGIAQAHAWKVIHQDIKPANILVPEYDGTPVPKVIDFGTAISTGAAAEPESTTANSGGFIGTPNYMSPEQALGTAGSVDAQTDVFSLGVVLHELLTGLLPFETEPGITAEPDRVRQAIQARQFLLPSLRVEQCEPAQMIPLAALRRKSPSDLAAALRGDLDAILSKALAADRATRYSSVKALANDIRLHLENRPVSVINPGWAMRSRKFVQRHSISITAAGIVCGILLAAFCATVLQSLRSKRLQHAIVQHTAAAASANKKEAQMRSQKWLSLGLEAIGNQNVAEAMTWFSQAAQQAPPRSEERQLHQQRIHALAASVVLPIRVLQSTGPLQLLEFNPNGDQLLALTANGECLLWNWQTNQTSNLSQGLGRATAAEWSPVENRVALGLESGVIEIRDATSGKTVSRLAFGEKVEALRFSPDGQELAVAGKSLRLWNLATGEWSEWRWDHPARVFAIRYSADGNRLASACADRRARLFLLNRNQPGANRLLNEFHHETGVTGFTAEHCAAALIRTDPLAPLFFGITERLLTWTAMNELTIWDPAGNEQTETLKGTCLATRVVASPGSEWIAVTYPQGSAQLWSDKTFPKSALTRLKHQERICDLAFGPQAKWVLTTSADRTARLWQLPDGKPMLSPLMHAGEVAHGAVSKNGGWIATAQSDGQIRVWRLPRDDMQTVSLELSGRWNAQASPSGHQLLLTSRTSEGEPQQVVHLNRNASQNQQVQFTLPGEFLGSAWTAQEERFAVLTGSRSNAQAATGWLQIRASSDSSSPIQIIDLPFQPSRLTVNPQGNYFVISDRRGGLWQFDLDGSGQLTSWIPQADVTEEPDQALVFSASGNCIARCRAQGQLEVWDAESHQVRFSSHTPGPSRRRITVSPKGPELLITDPDGISQVIDLRDGQSLGKQLTHQGGVVTQGFSPDGRWVITSGHDGCLRISDWRTGDLVCPPLVHGDEVFGFDFAQNGDWIATACRDGTFRIWDTRIGAGLLPVKSVNEPLFDIRLSADNQSAVLMGTGSTVWIQNLRILHEATEWSVEELTTLSEVNSGMAISQDAPVNLSSVDWQDRMTRLLKLRPEYFRP